MLPAPRFVLVRPRNALNMGAAARALTNFGFDGLAAVAPLDPQWRLATSSAVYGSELLRRAPVLTLEEAVADCALVLGTASAHDRRLRRTQLTLPALRPWLRRRLKGGRLAVLFGSERGGLSNDELDHCHALLRIPTAEGAPSMNLGQAVAVTAYELARAGLERSVREPDEPLLEGRQAEEFVETALRAMEKARVNLHLSPAQRRLKFRRGLMRWRLTRGDAAFLAGLL
ncbi:MAG: RNA methyltransferase, partial [Elusimicrobia bacterium]|nr:RNA methyltransferase [Elusimicrobiota bacterium]